MSRRFLYAFFMILFAGGDAVYAAQNNYGDIVSSGFNAPSYLVGAADAWGGVFGGVGDSGEVVARMKQLSNQNEGLFYDLVSVIAYNNSALTIFNTSAYVDFARMDNVLKFADKTESKFAISATPFALFDEYDSDKNSDFQSRILGGKISVAGRISDKFVVGLGYVYGDTKTRKMTFDTDAMTNILSVGARYGLEYGFFINMDFGAGVTSWTDDKKSVGVSDSGAWDTNFMFSTMDMGIGVVRGLVFFEPSIGMRYVLMENEKHLDAAAQEYKRWWRNQLSGNAQINIGVEFAGPSVVWQPSVKVGGNIDIIDNGTDGVLVRLINGDNYIMPIDSPGDTSFYGGVGLEMRTKSFLLNVGYEMGTCSDYMSYAIKSDIKIRF